ncbi:sporulation integral membrane protein YtvI [Bacillus thermotolerans]|uniref:sporulation integral membrane protein YtvI n=1 Tax=Bacillus thermotolerans TaxID=1221996 RepID=UPI00058900E9|nr:sporulation integral membrane protein YtvI [Bacillus thermotolerans]
MSTSIRDKLIRLTVVVLSTVLLLYCFYYIAKLTYPFIIGFAVAFLMQPFIRMLETKIKLPRTLAAAAALLFLILLFAGGITLLIAETASGANYFASIIPRHIDIVTQQFQALFTSQVIPAYEQLTGLFQSLDGSQQNAVLTNIQETSEQFAAAAGQFIQSFFLKLPLLISWIPDFATSFIFSFLAAFFIIKDWEKLQRHSLNYLPKKIEMSVRKVFNALKKAMFGFFRAQFTLVSITTLIVLAGLLVLRVNYAITLALVAGLVDLLPYLGTGTLFIPWIIYEFIAGDSRLAIGLIVLYVIVIAQRQIMEPKILSSSIGLDPLATLLSLFIGFQLAGFFGLLLGPAVLVVLNALQQAGVFTDLWTYITGKSGSPPSK